MKLKYIFLASAVSLLFSGCNENSFLDNPPQATLSNETMTSSDGADLLINAAYRTC
jgi:ABC-type Fe3+-hydroxamate transport system substrate-binding protein